MTAFVNSLTTSFCTRPTNLSSTCVSGRPVRVSSVSPRRAALRMGLGEDGLEDDLAFARNCIEDGCSVDAVQDILTRLERRRGVLSLELSRIEEIMSVLAKENLGGDRGLIADAMEAAISIFSKANDDYPGVGDAATNPWTLDPLKKQPKL